MPNRSGIDQVNEAFGLASTASGTTSMSTCEFCGPATTVWDQVPTPVEVATFTPPAWWSGHARATRSRRAVTDAMPAPRPRSTGARNSAPPSSDVRTMRRSSCDHDTCTESPVTAATGYQSQT